MPPTILLSSPITFLSRQRTFLSSKETLKPSPLNRYANLPASSGKSLVPSSRRQTTKRQKKRKNELPRTPRSTSQSDGVSLVKYDSIKNKREKQSVLKSSVKKEFVPVVMSYDCYLYAPTDFVIEIG